MVRSILTWLQRCHKVVSHLERVVLVTAAVVVLLAETALVVALLAETALVIVPLPVKPVHVEQVMREGDWLGRERRYQASITPRKDYLTSAGAIMAAS